jgi:hypothetical protein
LVDHAPITHALTMRVRFLPADLKPSRLLRRTYRRLRIERQSFVNPRSADPRPAMQETRAMTSKIKTVLVLGLFAALATPALADVENDPVNSGRYLAGTPGPKVIAPDWMAMAQPDTTKRPPVRIDQTPEQRLFDRAVGNIY